MVLKYDNRTRERSGKQVVREAQAAKLTVTLDHEPTEAESRQRAQAIFLGRGDAPGDPTTDWLRAEQELRVCARLSNGPRK